MSQPAEIIVVGGGPGGLSAALSAARAGARVLLLDGYTQPGGQYFRQPPERLAPNGRSNGSGHTAFPKSVAHKQQQGRELGQQVIDAGVEIHSDVLVWNISEDCTLAAAYPGGTRLLRPEAVILATGTYERVVAFPGWTLPGVITSGAAQALMYQHIRPGRRVLLAGSGPLQLTTAADLLHAGVEVAAVLEGAQILPRGLSHAGALWGQWGRALEGAESLLALARKGVPYRTGWGILAAHGTEQVEGATIARLDAHWRPIPGSEQQVACDTLCMGYGFVPFNALARLAGARQEWRPELGGEVPARDSSFQTSLPGLYAVGDGAGVGGYRLAMLEGQIAGFSAAAALGCGAESAQAQMARLSPAIRRERAFQRMYGALFTPGPGIYELAQADTLVCRCEGVTLGELQQAVQAMNARTASEAKNITRCGMGECQGRVCGSMVTQTIARLAGIDPQLVSQNAARPPLFAMPLSQLCKEE